MHIFCDVVRANTGKELVEEEKQSQIKRTH